MHIRESAVPNANMAAEVQNLNLCRVRDLYNPRRRAFERQKAQP
jgi:hypothetical protein